MLPLQSSVTSTHVHLHMLLKPAQHIATVPLGLLVEDGANHLSAAGRKDRQ